MQIRELTRFVQRQVGEKGDAMGFIENLERRLHAHEMQNMTVYSPSAAAMLTEEEWGVLEKARPEA